MNSVFAHTAKNFSFDVLLSCPIPANIVSTLLLVQQGMARHYLYVLFTIASFLPQLVAQEWAEGECKWDPQCEALYKPGSKCLEGGICSNPYIAGYMNIEDSTSTFPKRTCNSNDDTTENCEPSILNYPEVRGHNGNWETPIFYAWIIQIFLSEFLQVPTAVGLLEDTAQASFYAPEMPMSWSSLTYAWDAI